MAQTRQTHVLCADALSWDLASVDVGPVVSGRTSGPGRGRLPDRGWPRWLRNEAIILTGQTTPPEADAAGARGSDHPPKAEDEQFEPLAARAAVHSDNPTFAELGTHPQIVEALAAVGITRAFAIQELTLPLAIAGHDVIGQARTGTGKTLGFGIPLLQRLATPQAGTPRALIVAPTRELAVQVTHDLATAGSRLGLRCLSIYGGRAYEPQVTALRQGVDVVVGTPGRLLDLREQGHLKLDRIEVLVLDEADEMLDLGFLPDIEKLISLVPADRQTLLFSATMPGPIVALARRFLRQPTQVRAESHDEHPGIIPPAVAQFAYRAHAMDKVEMLARILQARGRGLTMIFCRTKRTAAKIADDLAGRGFAAAAVHGDLGQGAREQALRAFRKGKVDVLVATDVAARGIDIEAVTHVINYQCPEDEKVYVHRIGRTARAGATGTAVTFVDWDELPRWKIICDVLELPLHEPPETYSTSAHLHIDLDIGENISGVLPAAQRVRAGLDAEDVEDLGETGRGRRGPKPAARHRPERHGPERHGRRSMRSTEPARAAGQSAEQLADEADLPAANERAPRPPGTRRRTRRGRPTERDLVGATGTATALAEAPSAAAAGDTPGAAGGNESSGGAVRRRRRGRAAPSGG